MENRNYGDKIIYTASAPGLVEKIINEGTRAKITQCWRISFYSSPWLGMKDGAWVLFGPFINSKLFITSPDMASDLEAAYREHAKGENQCQKQS